MSITRLARPEILALTPYSSAASEGERSSGILLDANENPYPAPSGLAASLNLNRYPDPQPQTLRQRMAVLYGARPENILVTRGSDEGIDVLVRTFCRPGLDSIMVFSPAFSMYGVAANIQGAGVETIPLTSDFSLDTEATLKAVRASGNIKLMFLCSPGNPTARSLDGSSVEVLLDELPDTIVVIDEAYIEFSGDESFASLVDSRENLVVLRTLSKAFGLAGARCGAVIANTDVIPLLARVLPPYPVPAPVLAAALEALSPAGLARTREDIRKLVAARNRLAAELAELETVEKVFPSDANFLLVRFAEPKATFEKLRAAGILVRDRDALVPGTLRITVGTDEENALLLAALDAPGAPGTLSTTDRIGSESRTTKETSIYASVNLDGRPGGEIDTGIGFFDHMLDQFATHGGFRMVLKCDGDTGVDAHHTVEDCMLALGAAISRALGDRKGIGRYGFVLPMDEVRAEVLIDMSGRPFCSFAGAFDDPAIGELPTQMIPHAFQSLSQAMGAAIQVRVDGENDHHKCEGAFKALGRAFRMAKARGEGGVPSTKGTL